MKRKVLIALAILILLLANFIAFYYMRPSVCLLTDEIPYSYMRAMDRPGHLTMDYRSTWRTTENLERLSRYDMVIDMTLDGVEKEDNVYRLEYDLESLFLSVLDELLDRNCYILYDKGDPMEAEFMELVSQEYPDFIPLPYDYQIDRSFYGILSDRIREGSYLVVFNLDKAMDLVRFLDKDIVLVTDYLDSAALEKGADIVAAPGWDGIIRGFLSIWT